jgi:FixJ family two-component response regulator
LEICVPTLAKTVAIIDDDEAVLDATSGFLQSLGYATIVFTSGVEFLASECGAFLGFLLSDISMPGLGGFELQDIVRVRYPAVAVILMTALRDDELRQRAFAGGARCFLTKPVLADDLIRCLGGP